MRRLFTLLALLLAVAFPALTGPAAAVQPDEILDDPELEARAREISKDLRCLVCRNEAIDESNAELARDLRLLVRERLVAGDSNAEVKGYLVERYGEYVLLNPRFDLGNALLWLSGPILLLMGGVAALAYLRRQSRAPALGPESAPLSAQERAELDRILGDEGAGR